MTTRILGLALVLAHLGLAETQKTKKNIKVTPEAEFAETVQPLVSNYCVGCHNPKYKQANLDLTQLKTMDSLQSKSKEWKKVAWRMDVGDMPPEKSPRPKPAAHKATLKWIRTQLAQLEVAEK